MAKQMPKADEGNPNEWLNTYADMVTLLLTFFVLLFACSNMDETKMQYIFQAFQMRGKFVNTWVGQQNPDTTDQSTIGNSSNPPANAGGEGEMPQSFDQLYQYLSDFIDSNNLSESVALDQGPTHITIRFNDNVLFDGDSWVLKDEGRKLIGEFAPAIKAINGSIQNLTVAGHTADVPFPVINPMQLSANRAVSVQNFLEFRGTVDNNKYICTGYGPNKPLESNDTEDGRAKNRRVELMLLRAENELDLNDPAVIKDILNEKGIIAEEYDPHNTKTDPPVLPDGAAEKIVSNIVNKFESISSSSTGFGPGSADGSEFIADETESGSSSSD